MRQAPVFKDVVLAGGGHAHALLLRMWAMRPLPGVRLTLVSPEPLAPYSGMLPGLLAGHYASDDIHVDLARLCQRAGARLLLDRAVGLDPAERRLLLENGPPLHYDLLSLDIGATPDASVPGVAEHAVPVKPIAGFHRRWRETLDALRGEEPPRRLALVGGGAGSVELALAMAWALKDRRSGGEPSLTLATAAPRLLPGYPARLMRAAEAACRELGVALRRDFRVSAVEAGRALGPRGQILDFDRLFWCAQAGAPAWLREAGLACDGEGFVRVDACLRSPSHPEVFAAGDVASFDPRPLPKAGVYAVRQAPVLFDNLRRVLLGAPPRPYRPQRRFLSLLALGGERAAGSRAGMSAQGAWVWRWKDAIDRRYMRRFSDLPAMEPGEPIAVPSVLVAPEERAETLDPEARCRGCGGKIGAGVLGEVLVELTGRYDPEDAAVSTWPAGGLVQSIDQLRAPVDDPFLFGRIAVFHALNDLWAMNARPVSLLVAASLPFAGRAAQKRESRRLMQGVLSACGELGVELLGGHSAEGADLALALTVNGVAGKPSFAKRGARAGDLLVLGKALGTGVLLAARMKGLARGEDLAAALTSMNRPQDAQARWLAGVGARACTDVSGFGLLGHLSEMFPESELNVALRLKELPLLPGAVDLAKAGVRSSLFAQNEAAVLGDPRWRRWRESPLWPLLLDPQTAGGLLAAIDPRHAGEARGLGLLPVGEVVE